MLDLLLYLYENKWKALLTVLFLYFLHRYVISPYLLCQYYVKQGCYMESFFPVIGILFEGNKNVKQHGDFLHSSKNYFMKHPEKQGLIASVFNFGSSAQVTIIDPKLIGEFLTQKYTKFTKFQFVIDGFYHLIGEGLAFQEGEIWKKNRTLLSGVFHFDLIKRNLPHFFDVTENYLSKDLASPKEKPQIVNLKKVFEKITSAVSQQLFLGPPSGKLILWDLPISEALISFTDIMNKSILTPYYFLFGKKFFDYNFRAVDKKLATMNQEFRQLCNKIIRQESEAINAAKSSGTPLPDDYVSVVRIMLKSGDIKLEDAASVEQVSTEIYNFLLAGKDTTMNMVQMAIYYLTKDKILYDRVVADVRGKPKDYESINSLRVLDGFIKEVLRVYGPALGLFTRVASENIDLGPLHIKKGTYLNIGTVYNHFNPKYFPDPYKIDPDRWLSEKGMEPFTFTSFSGGPRSCIGQHMAKVVSKVIIYTVLNRFDVAVEEGYKLQLGIEQQYGPIVDIPFILTLVEQ